MTYYVFICVCVFIKYVYVAKKSYFIINYHIGKIIIIIIEVLQGLHIYVIQ